MLLRYVLTPIVVPYPLSERGQPEDSTFGQIREWKCAFGLEFFFSSESDGFLGSHCLSRCGTCTYGKSVSCED